MADLRARLERASRPNAVKSSFAPATDELKIDAVPRVRESPPTGAVTITGTGQLLFTHEQGRLIKAGTTSPSVPKPDAAPTRPQP